MITENAEIQAQRAWGDKETGQSGTDGNSSRGTSQDISSNGSESLSTGRNDWAGGNCTGWSRQANPGGILDRLIQKIIQQIDETEKRLAELNEELIDLKKLSEQTINQVEKSE